VWVHLLGVCEVKLKFWPPMGLVWEEEPHKDGKGTWVRVQCRFYVLYDGTIKVDERP